MLFQIHLNLPLNLIILRRTLSLSHYSTPAYLTNSVIFLMVFFRFFDFSFFLPFFACVLFFPFFVFLLLFFGYSRHIPLHHFFHPKGKCLIGRIWNTNYCYCYYYWYCFSCCIFVLLLFLVTRTMLLNHQSVSPFTCLSHSSPTKYSRDF